MNRAALLPTKLVRAAALPMYRYQRILMERIIRAFRAGNRDVLLHAPPGAGKTLTGKALCAWTLRMLGGFLLIADEVHHHSTAKGSKEGNRAGEFVEALLERGGYVLGCSATPWSSGGEVIRKDTVVVALTLSEYQRQVDPATGKPFAPQHWEALPIVTGYRCDDETLAVQQQRPTREETELDENDDGESTDLRNFALEVVPYYVKQWILDAFRKVTMRPRTVEAARELIKQLKSRKVRKLLGREPRILDMSGPKTKEEMAEIQRILASEAKVRRYGDSQVDVIVAVRRMDEGTDWRLCSDVYTTGIPGTISFNVQLWSRGGRGKGVIEGYPAHSENVQRIFYFLPTLTEEAQERVLKQQQGYSDLMICTALIVESLEAGLSVVNTSANVSLGTKKPARTEPEGDVTDDEVLRADLRAGWDGDLVQNSLQFAKIVKSIKRLEATGAVKRVAEVVEKASRGLDEVERAALIQGTMAHLKTGHPDIAEEWERARRRVEYKVGSRASMKSSYRAPSIVRAEVEEAWRAFVEKYGEKVCPSVDKVLEKAASFSGAVCEQMVRLWDGQGFPWPEGKETLIAFAREHGKKYKAKHGKWPSSNTGPIDGIEATWGALELQLRRRCATDLPTTFGKKKRVFRTWDLTFLDTVTLVARNPDVTRRSGGVEGTKPSAVDAMLYNAWHKRERPGLERAITCQVDSIARLRSEVAADCWRFTLRGQKKPDPRPWAEILASGDNVKVEKAERIAYLDWTDGNGAKVWRMPGSTGPAEKASRKAWPTSTKKVA